MRGGKGENWEGKLGKIGQEKLRKNGEKVARKWGPGYPRKNPDTLCWEEKRTFIFPNPRGVWWGRQVLGIFCKNRYAIFTILNALYVAHFLKKFQNSSMKSQVCYQTCDFMLTTFAIFWQNFLGLAEQAPFFPLRKYPKTPFTLEVCELLFFLTQGGCGGRGIFLRISEILFLKFEEFHKGSFLAFNGVILPQRGKITPKSVQ